MWPIPITSFQSSSCKIMEAAFARRHCITAMPACSRCSCGRSRGHRLAARAGSFPFSGCFQIVAQAVEKLQRPSQGVSSPAAEATATSIQPALVSPVKSDSNAASAWDITPGVNADAAFEGALDICLMVFWAYALLVSGAALVKYCALPMGPGAAAASSAMVWGRTIPAVPIGTIILRAVAALMGVAIKGISMTTGAACGAFGWAFLSVAGCLLHLLRF